MLGFIIGFLCLWGLIRVWRGPRAMGWRGFGPWGRRRGGRTMEDRWMRFAFERLDTTPGQEKVIRQALREVREAAHGLHDDMHGLGRDVLSSFRDPIFDPEMVSERLHGGDERLEELRRTVVGALAQIHEALDPDQRDKLSRWLERAPRWGGPYRSPGWA